MRYMLFENTTPSCVLDYSLLTAIDPSVANRRIYYVAEAHTYEQLKEDNLHFRDVNILPGIDSPGFQTLIRSLPKDAVIVLDKSIADRISEA